MTVNCQAMLEPANGQGSDRGLCLAGDGSTMTIEFLRARLLSERAASKAARQEVQQIAEKVAELQARLDQEIKHRRKAEAAAEEVFAVLKAKGLASKLDALLSCPSVQERENGSEDLFKQEAECLQSCKEVCTDNNAALLKNETDNGDVALSQGQVMSEPERNIEDPLTERAHCDLGSESSKHMDSIVIGPRDALFSDPVGAEGKIEVSPDKNGEDTVLNEEMLSADAKEMQLNEAAENRMAIEKSLNVMLLQLNHEVNALPEDQPLKRKLLNWVDHVANMLKSKESTDAELTLIDTAKLLHFNGSSLVSEGRREIANDVKMGPEEIMPALNQESMKDAVGWVELAGKVNAEVIKLAQVGSPLSNPLRSASDMECQLETSSLHAIGERELVTPGESNQKLEKADDRACPGWYPPNSYQQFNESTALNRSHSSSDSQKGENWNVFTMPQTPIYSEGLYHGHQVPSPNFAMAAWAPPHTRTNYLGAERPPNYLGAERPPKLVNMQSSGRKPGLPYRGTDQYVAEPLSPRKSDDSLTGVDANKPNHIKRQPHEDLEKPHGLTAKQAYSELGRGHAYYANAGRYQGKGSMVFPFSSEDMGVMPESRRQQRPPVNDATLSLMDDKSGRLGGILMALNLAKQQVKDEDDDEDDEQQMSSHRDNIYVDAEVAHMDPRQVPMDYYRHHHHAWRPIRAGADNQGPIVHLPTSPTSDRGVSGFERHDGLRRSQSVSVNFMMPGFEAHLQPRGEVHLGNGITLYTD